MVLFCMVCMKRLTVNEYIWTIFGWKNTKKYEKSVTDVRKGKTMESWFPTQVFHQFNNDKKCFALCHFIFTIQNKVFGSVFFNCQSCKCGQPSHNHINCDLGDPNFSYITIVIPIVACRITAVHLKNLWVRIFIHTHIHTSRKSLSGDF